MKKISIQKLALKRETVRQLDADALNRVAGGISEYTNSRCICDPTQRVSLSGCPGCHSYPYGPCK